MTVPRNDASYPSSRPSPHALSARKSPASGARRPRSRRPVTSEHYRPYKQKWDGPRVLNTFEAASPPVCVYCGGECECVCKLKSCDNIERGEDHWRCTKSASCVGRDHVVIIRRYPLAPYNRRS